MPEPGPDTTPEGMPPCDLLVFDLDGTLIDSQLDLVHSVNATLASLNRPALAPHLVASFIGDGAAMLVQRALEATGGFDVSLLAQAMPSFLAYYKAHMLDNTHLYPGVLESLRGLRMVMPLLPMAVLSNKPVRPSREICTALGLAPFFFQTYGGNSFATKKPDPLGLCTLIAEASALAGLDVARHRTVLIGDSHVDVETARAAGVRCIGCSYGLDKVGLRASAPDLIVESPTQWLPALCQILS